MNWYIGQEIVCVKTHRERVVVSGRTYKIKALRTAPCKCGHVLIDVGVFSNTNRKSSGCVCGFVFTSSGIWWLHENRFVPLDQDISELTNILEQPIKQVQEL